MKSVGLIIFLIFELAFGSANAANCEVTPPTGEADGNEFGLIYIPGAQIKGEAYLPLSLVIQDLFPGNMWIGVTEGWFGNFPNPLEIEGAINDCFQKAQDNGYATDKVFQAGHSLGGIMLEQWALDHPAMSKGIMMFGSYLPNGLFGNGDTNVFPVPVLTVIGTLDGGAISYLAREARESRDVETMYPEKEGQFPVFAIERCNHAQVASGEMPDVVIENDIDPEVDGEEAYKRYAGAAASFMVSVQDDQFVSTVVDEAKATLKSYQDYTDDFLRPFQEMRLLEQNEENTISPWTMTSQGILAGIQNLESLYVENELVTSDNLGPVKPELDATDDCTAEVKTYAYNSYSFDPLDFGSLISSDVIKAKFKLEDLVRSNCCEDPSQPRNQCRDVNRVAFEKAMSVASEEAKDRYMKKGRQLMFGEDYVAVTGIGWEYSFGLDYNKVNETHVELVSTALISEPDFIIPSASGMHYCDLLSPYRALEWIYISGVVHG